MPEVTLNLPGRDQKIEQYKQYLRNLGEGGHPLHDLRSHGQRDLEQRPRRRPRGFGPRIRPVEPEQEGLSGPARAGRSPSHTAACSRRKRSGTTTPTSSSRWPRSPKRSACRIGIHPGRPAGARARRRSALHLQQLRGLQAGPGDRQQPERRDLPVLWHLARRRPPTHRKGPGGDDPPLRRRQDLEDPLPQRQRAARRTSSKRSWTMATTTCTKS